MKPVEDKSEIEPAEAKGEGWALLREQSLQIRKPFDISVTDSPPLKKGSWGGCLLTAHHTKNPLIPPCQGDTTMLFICT